MVIKNLVRKICKTIYFLALVVSTGRTIGEPYTFINHDFVIKIGQMIYGSGDIGAENIDDTYFYIDFVIVIFIAMVVYKLTMKLITAIRKKINANSSLFMAKR